MPPTIVHGLVELKSFERKEPGVSDWFTVTQPMVNQFADLTLDPQWIHTDSERAKRESPYGTTIAHGFLTLAMLSHLHRDSVQIHSDMTRSINYGFNRIRFPAAVPVGSRIRLHSTLNAVEELEGGVQITWDLSVEIEGQAKPAVVAQWIGRAYR